MSRFGVAPNNRLRRRYPLPICARCAIARVSRLDAWGQSHAHSANFEKPPIRSAGAFMGVDFHFVNRVRSGSALARFATTLASRQDSSSLHGDYALLISAHDFVAATADIIQQSFARAAFDVQVRSVEPGSYDVLVRRAGEDDVIFLA